MAALSSSVSPLPSPFLPPPPLPSLPTLSSPAPTFPPPLSAASPLPLTALSSLPRSPARSCSIWEGLLGLASLQCREGQGGCFSTMRWRMVHQEKRVYQVCGFVFVCVCDSEGVAYLQMYMVGIHHGWAAADESAIMDEWMCDCEVEWVCSCLIFTCLSLCFYIFSVQFEISHIMCNHITCFINDQFFINEIILHLLQWPWGDFAILSSGRVK